MHVIDVTLSTNRLSSREFTDFPLRYTSNQFPPENRSLPRLITRSSDIHAAGCFTLEDIPKGTVVLEYTGERISKEEGDVRYDGRPFTYLFGIGDGAVVIDGHGMAMFVNHSCDPNSETDEINGRIFIKTLRNLKAGEEITYDYWLYDGDDEAPCSCGSRNCRGSMYSPAEVKRMQRDAAKQKKLLERAARKDRTASKRTASL
jgi:SET domain-containing protein